MRVFERRRWEVGVILIRGPPGGKGFQVSDGLDDCPKWARILLALNG